MNVEALRDFSGRIITSETVVGVAFLGVVSLLIVPVPGQALDLLLAVSIGIAAIVFLTALFSERPTDFSVFPTLLLISTLLRLSLNVASTRLILLNGHEGPDAAGEVIEAFAEFVVGGNLGVGIIIFLALVLINFVVITKGAGRIAEVAARFTLDAMPGRQMAIDAELNAGVINETQARERRGEIESQANFYGAMDGASKFVRGDAIAGLIITGVNLVGGIIVGMTQQNLSFGGAVDVYPVLTIGDGLVSQMPALVVSTSAGLAISRASGRSEFGTQVIDQMLGMRNVLMIAAAFLIFIGLLPGLPLLPFAVLAGLLLFLVYRRGEPVDAGGESEVVEDKVEEPSLGEALRVDTLTLEVGYGLLALVDISRGGDIPERVKKLRRQLAQELGIIVPPVRVVDNLQLRPGEYGIRLYGVEIARGEVMSDRHMAIDSAGVQSFPSGVETKEPVFGLKAFWIREDDRQLAESRGMTVVDPSTVLTTHLAEVLRRSADQLVGRDQVDELLSYVKAEYPKLINELIPDQLSLGELVRILQNLLIERVSVRNLRGILEAVASEVPSSKDIGRLSEAARAGLKREITKELMDDQGCIYAVLFGRDLELLLRGSLTPGGQLAPDPEIYQMVVEKIASSVRTASESRHSPCVLVADDLRRPLRELIGSQLPDIPVIAIRELDRQAELRVVGTISAKE
ncbi:MAG: flagellar biosynthesis protein FlhA [Myxococcales bacterium]|nr:flagellar biosynthesis protein FlhA [Myxococcales bacterium]